MANKIVIFDSNIWISYFNRNDSGHQMAMKIFAKQARQTIIMTEYILLEVATVLKQQLGYQPTRIIIEALLDTENIKLLPSVDYFTDTVRLFLNREDEYLSFVDVSLLVLAKDFTIETFDKKLKTAIKN